MNPRAKPQTIIELKIIEFIALSKMVLGIVLPIYIEFQGWECPEQALLAFVFDK